MGSKWIAERQEQGHREKAEGKTKGMMQMGRSGSGRATKKKRKRTTEEMASVKMKDDGETTLKKKPERKAVVKMTANTRQLLRTNNN